MFKVIILVIISYWRANNTTSRLLMTLCYLEPYSPSFQATDLLGMTNWSHNNWIHGGFKHVIHLWDTICVYRISKSFHFSNTWCIYEHLLCAIYSAISFSEGVGNTKMGPNDRMLAYLIILVFSGPELIYQACFTPRCITRHLQESTRCIYNPRLILGLRPANERRRYTVTPSLIDWTQA